MTKLSIFDKNWKSEKDIQGSLRKWQNWAFLTKLKNRKIHSPLKKWQNWAFLTKLKNRKKYKGLSENDKIENFWQNWRIEKSIVLSENDKIRHFWQNWRSEKIHGPLTKWQEWGIFDKNSLLYHNTQYVLIVYLCLSHNLKSTFQKWQNGPFFNNIEKVKKKYTFLSQKMTKLSIFDKIKEAKKYTGLSENDKIKHFWQNTEKDSSEKNPKRKIHSPLTKWQNWAFLTKLKKRKKNTRALSQNDKMGHFWQK